MGFGVDGVPKGVLEINGFICKRLWESYRGLLSEQRYALHVAAIKGGMRLF